jgi:hypothetical protein
VPSAAVTTGRLIAMGVGICVVRHFHVVNQVRAAVGPHDR